VIRDLRQKVLIIADRIRMLSETWAKF